MSKQLSLLLFLLFTNCAPKAILSPSTATQKYAPVEDFEPFVCLESDTIAFEHRDLISSIEIKDYGLTIDCDYESVKSLAIQETKKLGGNCLVISEHKMPTIWSTCHGIKGTVYRISNPKKYEYEIIWHQLRPLTIQDFKGSTDKRPFLAATYSSFRYTAKPQPKTNKLILTVQTYFNCNLSYFKPTETDSMTLQHEQAHFDITEIYARKFIEKIHQEVHNLNDFKEKQKNILDVVGQELQLKQDEYDSGVYADNTKQPQWNMWIDKELQLTGKYSNKEIEINLK
jgi:hypothetical protein